MKDYVRFAIIFLFCLRAYAQNDSTKLTVNYPVVDPPDTMTLSADKALIFMKAANGYEIRNSADFKVVASGSFKNTGLLSPHACITRDFTLLAYNNEPEKKITVLNPLSGAIVTEFPFSTVVSELLISPDGKAIIVFGVKEYYFYAQVSAGAFGPPESRTYHEDFDSPSKAVVSPDGRYMAVSTGEAKYALVIHEVASGKVIFADKSGSFFSSGYKTYVNTIFFSENSQFLFGQDYNRRAYVHTLNGEKKSVSSDLRWVYNATFSEQGEISFCPRKFKHHKSGDEYTYSLCLPDPSMQISFGAASPILKDKHIPELIPQAIDFLQPDYSAEAQKIAPNVRAVRKKFNPVSKILVTATKKWAGTGAANITVYSTASGAPVEISNFSKEEFWNSYSGDMDVTSATDFAITDEGNIILVLQHSPPTIVNRDGHQLTRFKNSKAQNPFNDMVQYHSGTGMVAGAYSANIALWNKAGEVIGEAVEENGTIDTLLFDSAGKWLISKSSTGILRLRRIPDLVPVATAIRIEDNSWALAANDGRYDTEGSALSMLHYSTGREAVSITDFDKTFFTPGLITDILSGKPAPERAKATLPAKIEVTKSLVGKIHSINGEEIVLGCKNVNLGENLFVIVDGRKIYLKVTFPMHTGAKSRAAKPSEKSLLSKGMPVFR